MKLDKTLYPHTVAIAIFAISLLYTGNRLFSAQSQAVMVIETFQSLWLLFCALFTWCYIRPLRRETAAKSFWLWSISWWILLFGRGISWGRNYFPDEPKLYFRIISIVLIGVTACALLLPVIRREVIRRFRQESLPMWDILLLVLYFVIVDTIEHHRLFAFLFVYDTARTDLLEELFELPFMFSLFAIAFLLQRNEKQTGTKTVSISHSALHDIRN
ncbi:hypothetical protein CS369_16135 [Candidatus Symbiopectobacterium sp. 'North America']|uniref:hypothetical protein n=1 Tax=Candidatus Symbiopectobacterium sp. 'North America' TaxID=2794574 RepID=UPI0018CB33BC|nr:hypothetical protein [Candidatus Symbiopectobacterium sp. 'North America']MBG6245910.1 hypothetical protein [Candidatus Symbiopectobacterium sp. 'North America']